MEELIYKYFPTLSTTQKQQYAALYPLYKEWNQKVNVISRKDIDNLYLHHILHSLAIAKFISFPRNSQILDVGTGGGFPGIPLAIMFPDCTFTLCDSISKKINVVNSVATTLKLDNLTAVAKRAETLNKKFHFVVSRAVADLSVFLPLVQNLVKNDRATDMQPNGIICLKGGAINQEIMNAVKKLNMSEDIFSVRNINIWYEEEWFKEKYLIFIKR